MDQVKARFRVTATTPTKDHEGQPAGGNVVLGAVYGDGENAKWAKATPSGQLQMHVSYPEVFAFFPVGAVMELTFTVHEPVPAASQPEPATA